MIKVVGNSIRIICIKHRVTVTQLADDIQCNRKSLYNYINGNIPDLQTALRIANYFHLELKDIFKIVSILIMYTAINSISISTDNCTETFEIAFQYENKVRVVSYYKDIQKINISKCFNLKLKP